MKTNVSTSLIDWRQLNGFHTFSSDVRNQYGAALDELIASLQIDELSCYREQPPTSSSCKRPCRTHC